MSNIISFQSAASRSERHNTLVSAVSLWISIRTSVTATRESGMCLIKPREQPLTSLPSPTTHEGVLESTNALACSKISEVRAFEALLVSILTFAYFGRFHKSEKTCLTVRQHYCWASRRCQTRRRTWPPNTFFQKFLLNFQATEHSSSKVYNQTRFK